MSSSIITDYYRTKLADAVLNGGSVPSPVKLVLGSGGHSGTQVIDVSSSSTAVRNKVGEKNATVRSKAGPMAIVVGAEFSAADIAATDSQKVISEAAIIDNTGQAIAIKNFSPKFIEIGETYSITMRINF